MPAAAASTATLAVFQICGARLPSTQVALPIVSGSMRVIACKNLLMT
ncbi:MAG: hypothetical protein QOC84_2259 [Bradyrhizobium sp.]|jgi:hypothetical protein|nr:hypothetical protein [Bradyrhizobium sp.]